jgi:hypothetical protein
MSICTVDGCERQQQARELCSMHYARLCRRGDPLATRKTRNVDICTVNECDEIQHARGYCKKHHLRFLKHGDPNVVANRWDNHDIEHRYIQAHNRVRKLRGLATDLLCVDCGDQAEEWSYDHNDPEAKADKHGPYSTNVDCYSPRCAECHHAWDNGPAWLLLLNLAEDE